MANDQISLRITSREGIVFDGKVNSITSHNDEGKFDILPYHANFISLLKDEIIYTDSDNNSHRLDIDSALLRKRDTKAEIYLGVKSFTGDDEKEESNEDE